MDRLKNRFLGGGGHRDITPTSSGNPDPKVSETVGAPLLASGFHTFAKAAASIPFSRDKRPPASGPINEEEEEISKIKDDWIHKMINEREAEFTNVGSVSVMICTWNVAGKKMESKRGLEDWLCRWHNPDNPPDIVVVGLQEIVDLNAVNVAMDAKSQQRAAHWEELFTATLNSQNTSFQYGVVCRHHMVGLFLCVFVKQTLRQNISKVCLANAGVGALGMMGNKGAVSIRMQIHDSMFCFVCAHLAAHRENVDGRNQDFYNILMKTVFRPEENYDSVNSSSELDLSAHSVGINELPIKILDHETIFWFGDLNYHIDLGVPTQEVLRRVYDGDLEFLRSQDQLNKERIAGRAFTEFNEGTLTFNPTYKYQPDTDKYESRPEKKLRAPAWCDRVLWSCKKGKKLQQHSYNQVSRLRISDHRPVHSEFTSILKRVISSKHERVWDELQMKVSQFEQDARNPGLPRPQIQVENLPAYFDLVRYKIESCRSLYLVNSGQVAAFFIFKPKLEETSISKIWLSVQPKCGILSPGERLEIKLTVLITTKIAQLISEGLTNLEDLLVLHVLRGTDIYIQVQANYARSCYGSSLLELVNIADPIRNVPFGSELGTPMTIPKELWRMINDILSSEGEKQNGLFTTLFSPAEVESIRECLDTGLMFEQHSVHSMCEALTTFLASLHPPVIPNEHCFTSELEGTAMEFWTRRLLDQLPNHHYNTLIYVIAFFRELLKSTALNKLSPEILGLLVFHSHV